MSWSEAHEYILLHIFQYLPPHQLRKAACVCHWWNSVIQDNNLWKLKIQQRFQKKVRYLSPGINSWRSEWERLSKFSFQQQIFEQLSHGSGVTGSTFSSDGQLLATCGNDVRVCIWKIGESNNVDLLWEENFSRLNWSHCSSVQFNQDGSSLLLSGVLKTNIARKRLGEILVISTKEDDIGTIRSRINTRPHDTLGCWFNNNYVISSEHDWLAHGISVNKLWINKVNFTEDCSPSLACMRQLYRMYNCGGASLRSLSVCSVPKQNKYVYRKYLESRDPDQVLAAQLYLAQNHALHVIPVPPTDETPSLPEGVDNRTIRYLWDGRYVCDYDENPTDEEEVEQVVIKYMDEYYEDREQDHRNGMDDSRTWLWEDESLLDGEDEEDEDEYELRTQWEYFSEDQEDTKEEVVVDKHINEQVLNDEDKLLIFTTGRQTFLPHQIGIKLMTRVRFKQHLDVNKDIKQFIREGEERREEERRRLQNQREIEVPPYHNYGEVMHMFDIVDVVFDFQGYILGYGISEDSRYMYVNMHPWPRGYPIQQIFDPPPAGDQPEVVVIDLAKMKVVGRSEPRQRIFCPADSFQQSPVQVTHQHVLTSAGNSGLLLDRHYGEEVCRLEHEDISTCTGNPHFLNHVVTGGEDGVIKVWS